MSLRRQALSAGRWTTASSVTRGFLQVAQTMVLARLLEPADFGLMAAAGSLLAVASILADFGVNRIIMHRKDLDADMLRSLFWFNLASAMALALLFSGLAPVLAWAFGEPKMIPVIVLCALAFPLGALGAQFRTLAAKEFRFAALARNEVLSALAGLAAGVLLALQGAGVYALLGAALVSSACSSGLAWIWLSEGHRPGWRIQFRGIRNWLPFSGFVIGDNIAGSLHREAEVFVAGIVAGPAAIGVFAVPRALCLRLSNAVVNPVITRVGIPVMVRLQGDEAQVRRAYLFSLKMTSSINFPIYVFIGLFAAEVVALLYGPRWHQAVPFLQIFAAWGLIRSTGNPVGSLLIAGGHARRAFAWNVVLCLVVPLLLWLGGQGAGLRGLAWTMLAVQCATFFALWQFLVRPLCGATMREYLGQLHVPLLGAAVSGACAWQAAQGFEAGLLRLAVGGVVMLALYLLLSRRFNRQWFDTMLDLFRVRVGASERRF